MTNTAAYNFGRDYALNGANKINCHFSIFLSPETTKSWELGKKNTENNIKFIEKLDEEKRSP